VLGSPILMFQEDMTVDVTTFDLAIAVKLRHDKRLVNFSIIRASISPNYLWTRFPPCEVSVAQPPPSSPLVSTTRISPL
jgi:hypothetical protein